MLRWAIFSQDKQQTFRWKRIWNWPAVLFWRCIQKMKIKLPTFECKRIHSYASQPICIKLQSNTTNSFLLESFVFHYLQIFKTNKKREKNIFFESSLIFNFIGNYQLEPYPYLDTSSRTSFIIAQHLPASGTHKNHTGQFEYWSNV